jgi:cysteine desulfurase/selenocysteine lyase
MTTTPSTPSSADVPAGSGLPDIAVLTQYANALFRAVPGSGVDPAFNVEPPSDLSPPGAGASLGSTPSLATVPTIADLPSSVDDKPVGPAAIPPGGLETAVEPGSIRPTASPAYYFLSDAKIPSYGAPGESDLLAFLPTLGLPEAPADPGVGTPTAATPHSAPPAPAITYSPFLSDRDGLSPSFGADPRPSYDLFAVRRDFPILSERVDGKRLIWFDNAATTQKPRAVIERLAYFYEHENSNIHRAAHTLAARSTDAYENARSTVARFINASTPDEIVFVRGTTEGINLIASTWGAKNLREGDEVLLSHLEHHANIVPWQLLQKQLGFTIKVIPVDEDGQILLDEYTNLVTDRTKLVSFTWVSNALGTITPVKKMIETAHRAGATVLVDAAQSIAHVRTDVQDVDADFLVFSGHKIYGPTGIGVVYGKRAILEDLPPYQGGGNMISDVTFERSLFHPPPGRFEAGTGNIADAVGLGAALDYVDRLGLENIAQYEHDLLGYATNRMLTVPGLHFVGTAREKASILGFVLDGYAPEEVGQALSRDGIAVRAGHHCAQPILRRFGHETTVRPSLALYNTPEEVDELVDVLCRLAERV